MSLASARNRIATLALSAPASADVKFPDEHAACVAQAWVPFNTDPEEGTLGPFISEFAQTGEWGQEIAQHGCKP